MAIQAQLYSENIGFPLFGSRDRIDNGYGGGGYNQFAFNLHQKSQLQQLQLLQNQQQWNQSLCFDHNGASTIYCETMGQFIKSHNKRLRLVLQEKRKQQVAVLVEKIQPKATILLGQKDEEMTKARNITTELENMLKKLEMENQAWQSEGEAMVISLNNKLEQLREQHASCWFNNGVDDAESCWCEVKRGFADNRRQGEERRRNMRIVCKCCKFPSPRVLLLPCRHLCSCKDSAGFLESCPRLPNIKES